MGPFVIPAVMMAAQIASSLFSQNQAKKDAKKAQEEQDKNDAWDNFLAAAGGYAPTKSSPVIVQPSYDMGEVMQQSVGTGLAMYGAQQAADNAAADQAFREQSAAYTQNMGEKNYQLELDKADFQKYSDLTKSDYDYEAMRNRQSLIDSELALNNAQLGQMPQKMDLAELAALTDAARVGGGGGGFWSGGGMDGTLSPGANTVGVGALNQGIQSYQSQYMPQPAARTLPSWTFDKYAVPRAPRLSTLSP